MGLWFWTCDTLEINEEDGVIEDYEGTTIEFSYAENIIYDDPNQLMVYWW